MNQDYAEPAAMLPGLVVQAITACADRRYDTAAEKAEAVVRCAEAIMLWARNKDAEAHPVKIGPERS